MSKIKLGSREIRLPRSRIARIAIGVALVIGGIFGFLPFLGFWMIPLGLLILAIDVPPIRRLSRRLAVWWGRRRQARKADKAEKSA